jgi:GTPase
LLFVVDVAGSEGRNPIEDVRNLRREVDLYDSALSKRPWYIIANKIDLPGASANLNALRNQFRMINVIDVSAKTGEGIEALKRKLEIWVGEAA